MINLDFLVTSSDIKRVFLTAIISIHYFYNSNYFNNYLYILYKLYIKFILYSPRIMEKCQ